MSTCICIIGQHFTFLIEEGGVSRRGAVSGARLFKFANYVNWSTLLIAPLQLNSWHKDPPRNRSQLQYFINNYEHIQIWYGRHPCQCEIQNVIIIFLFTGVTIFKTTWWTLRDIGIGHRKPSGNIAYLYIVSITMFLYVYEHTLIFI